jgi:primosomal protein N'
MLRADQRGALQRAVKLMVAQADATASHQLRWSVDVDPVTLD